MVSTKKDYLWNMIGSICYSGTSFFYLLFVTRICGVYEAGVFALAYSTAQLFLTVGRYGVRAYHATDVQNKYTFKDYSIARFLTCALMLLLGFLYPFFMGFEQWKAGVCFWVTAFKMVDAVEDVFHGELQRKFHVALMGQVLALRNVFSCCMFVIVLLITKDLFLCCVFSAISSFMFCVFVNAIALYKVVDKRNQKTEVKVFKILTNCFPIFVGTFLSLYIYNIPKYGIDVYMSEEIQTYYGILFMPSFVITLFSEIITKPVMTSLTIEWQEDAKKFIMHCMKIFVMIFCMLIVIIFAGHFIGRYLLEIIYGVSLEKFKLEFVVLLIGGGISACVYIMYNLLIAIRQQKCIIYVYLIAALVSTISGFALVESLEMIGAALAYFLSCMFLFVIFAGLLLYFTKKRVGEQNG